MIHQSGRESASKCSFFAYTMSSPYFLSSLTLPNRKIHFAFSTVTSATLNLNTLSKHCDKVLQLNLKSLEFRACPSCKYLNKHYSASVNCLSLSGNLISCPSHRHDFQFFNTQRLTELYEKEVRYLMVGLFKSNTTGLLCLRAGF